MNDRKGLFSIKPNKEINLIVPTDEAPSRIAPPIKKSLPMPKQIKTTERMLITSGKMIRWLMINACVGLMPLYAGAFPLIFIEGQFSAFDFTREILFFVIMINAISIYELMHIRKERFRFFSTVFTQFFVLAITASAMMYALFTISSSGVGYIAVSENMLFYYAVIMAICSFVLGAILQVFINKTSFYE